MSLEVLNLIAFSNTILLTKYLYRVSKENNANSNPVLGMRLSKRSWYFKSQQCAKKSVHYS